MVSAVWSDVEELSASVSELADEDDELKMSGALRASTLVVEINPTGAEILFLSMTPS